MLQWVTCPNMQNAGTKNTPPPPFPKQHWGHDTCLENNDNNSTTNYILISQLKNLMAPTLKPPQRS